MIKLKEEACYSFRLWVNQMKCWLSLQKWAVDCFLLAGRYTLLDQTSLDELTICKKIISL